MAQEIQRLIEECIPEAEDLLERGLFNKDEITSLLSKRREFETRLHRFEADKADFLQYIEYELNFDKLREKRKIRLNVKRNGTADSACTKRVNFIFDRALKKFKGDIDLWIAAIEYAQVKHIDARISKLIASAIRLFPNREGFWVMAASHEFETNKNVEEARAVMMQGLRVNPKSESLWVEYFRLEFLFLNQVAERRALLGIDKDAEVVELKADILKVVYRNAARSLPSSGCSFRIELLRVCEAFVETATKSIADEMINFIVDDLTETFGSTDAQVWQEKAKRAVNETEADSIYESACKTHPSSQLWEARILHAYEQNNWSKVKDLCARASEAGLLNEETSLTWIAAVEAEPSSKKRKTRRGGAEDDESPLELVNRLTALFSESAPLWEKRCAIEPNDVELALKHVRPIDSLHFWKLQINKDGNKLQDALKCLTRSNNCMHLVEELLCQVLGETSSPISLIRRLESTLINQVPLRCYESALENTSLNVEERRNLFERCCESYPSAANVWQAYVEFEKRNNNNDKLQRVVRRALVAAPEIAASLRRPI
jgi:hypothetical protein